MKGHCLHENCGLPRLRTTVSIPYPLCCRCGLVVLRNDVSQRARRAACPGTDG